MSVRELLKEKVDAVATERGLVDNKAFGYWFLEEMEDHSPEDAESIVVDGPWDGGRDAVAWDPSTGTLTIHQFKYSDSVTYVLKGFADLEKGLTHELEDIQGGAGADRPASVAEITKVRLVIVSLSADHERLEDELKTRTRTLRAWRTRRGHAFKVELENVDLRYFMQAFDRLFGVDASLDFIGSPVSLDRGDKKVYLGLLDLRSLAEHIGDESLIYFNIRSFLGVRKGSINEAIRATVKDPDLRDDFWLYNNGIVALCTKMRRRLGTGWKAKTLTIVNGAQTVNTVGRYLADSTLAAEDPVPVVAKIIEVDEDDLAMARAITKTSNSQTPTSNSELRAVDPLHFQLRIWLEERGWSYVFRRGDRHVAGLEKTSMKELAQAHLAFWGGKPHVSFSRPGRIFADDGLYEEAFDPEAVLGLRASGDEAAVADYVDRRLLAVATLQAVRTLISSRGDALDKKWKSVTYHLVWIVGELLAPLGAAEALAILPQAMEQISDDLLDALKDFVTIRDLAVPKSMKSGELASEMSASNFWTLARIEAARAAISGLACRGAAS